MTRGFGTGSGGHAELAALLPALRRALKRALALVNGKGGAGKTTIAANLGATLALVLAAARSPKRVLVIQLDKQGDLALDLGIMSHQQNDRGGSVLQTVMGQGTLNIIRDVRPQLDVVPAGSALKEVAALLDAAKGSALRERRLRFVKAVAAVADQYEWILIDCPPGDEQLQVLGLCVAQWLLIPCAFDKASEFGLEGVDEALEQAAEINPDIELLGVLLFAFEGRELRTETGGPTGEITYREVGQRARVRRRLQKTLDDIESDAPVFQAVIGASRVIAEACRVLGRVAPEMSELAGTAEWRALRKIHDLGDFSRDTAEGLAADYEAVALEMVDYVKSIEGSSL